MFPPNTFSRAAWTLIALALAFSASSPARESRWADAGGAWEEAGRWSRGVPDSLTRALLFGRSEVALNDGRRVVGGLLVGTGTGDRVRLRIAGGELIVRRNFAQIGEMRGGSGEVVIEGGALHCAGPVYVGGANSGPDRECRGELRIRGGNFAARLVTLGWGQGAQATLAIEGSRASAVHVLEYLDLGAYLPGAPSTCTLAFTLDEHGVTPITIQNPAGALRLNIAPLKNICRLRVSLSDVPPRGDVTLVAVRTRTKGEFETLPEGAEVSAKFAARTYRWTLTYRGGASGCDVVLANARGHAPDAPATHARAIPAPPKLLWTEVPLRDPLPGKFEPAFAGAEGFGAIAAGGRGGREIAVENLNDDGPGSFRAALAGKGARTIVFRIGGTIELRRPLILVEPFVTVLGQSAPGGGITLRSGGMIVRTHDVILRHLRIRPGEQVDDTDALEFYDAERCIVDHCSLGWGTDETCSVVGLSDAITIQHCIISEGLNAKGHSMASIAGGERVTWHHNLFAHCRTRNPRFADVANCDFRNNVVYNWADMAAYGQFERVNFVGNFFKPGPSTRQRPPRFHSGGDTVQPASFHVHGNVMDGHADLTRDNWLAIGFDRGVEAREPFPAPAVTTEDAPAAYGRVLDGAGATLPQRDAIDARVVRSVRDGTGRILNTSADAGVTSQP